MTKNKKNAGTTEPVTESPIMSGRSANSDDRDDKSLRLIITKAIFVEPVSFLGHSLTSVTSLGEFNIELKVIGNTTCLVLTPKDIVTAAQTTDQPVQKSYIPLSNVRYFETIA